ncbi:MAG: alginate export family protein [Ignavibacteriales bacterium]|nr:alginate export family protein [Ignavibacteriales bacterium]
MRTIRVLFLLFVLVCSTFAQENPWIFSGQVQIRSELDGRDFNNESYMPFMTVMRTRLNAAKSFEDKVDFFFQAQDSRVFGQEGSPTTYTKNLDVHQAYVSLNNLFDLPVRFQAGRFILSYGTERFLGASHWSHVGRSFDGARLSIEVNGKLDVFGVTNTDYRSFISNADVTVYPANLPVESTSSLYGLWYNSKITPRASLDFFGLYDLNRKKTNTIDPDTSVLTLGTTVQYTEELVWATLEAAYQDGKRSIKDVSAFLISISGAYKVNMHKIGLGADIVSGTEDQLKENNVFSTSYGTNHKFYGYMDYFTDINKNTYGLGLMDFYVTWDILPKEYPLSFSANLHHFLTAKEPSVTDGIFGQELDLTLRYQFVKNTSLSWGGSFFIPGEFMKAIFNTASVDREDMAFWSYVMITANF